MVRQRRKSDGAGELRSSIMGRTIRITQGSASPSHGFSASCRRPGRLSGRKSAGHWCSFGRYEPRPNEWFHLRRRCTVFSPNAAVACADYGEDGQAVCQRMSESLPRFNSPGAKRMQRCKQAPWCHPVNPRRKSACKFDPRLCGFSSAKRFSTGEYRSTLLEDLPPGESCAFAGEWKARWGR